MAAEAILDLDGAPGAPRLLPAPATSAITRERSAPPSGWAFVAGALLLGIVTGAGAWALGQYGVEQPAETSARAMTFGLADMGLALGRAVSAVSVGILATSVAFAGRNLARSGAAGLLVGTLVALDPAILVYGRLALPTALTLACMALALVGFTSHRPWLAWVGGFALAAASLVDPRSATWGIVLLFVALLRGHIYASPRHLAIAAVQAIVLPAAGVLVHVLLPGNGPIACLAPGAWQQLTLRAAIQPGASLLAQPGPATWLVGMGAVAFLGVGGMLFGATQFRLARANGRVQARLVSPFPPAFGRGIWVLLLVLATAVPQAWLILFALALALGVQDLGEDAPGFGLTLAVALLLFAALVLWRSWGAVTGLDGPEGVADALGLVPWAKASVC